MTGSWKIMRTVYKLPEGYERRMQIVDAINDLFASHSLDDMTISMICEQAGVSKPTFYRYFSDKYDAVCWYHYIYSSMVLYEVGRTLTWHEATRSMLEHVVEEHTFYERAFVSSDSHESLIQFGIQTNIDKQLEVLKENDIEVTPELEYQVQFWARSVNRAISAWVHEGFPYTPEELAHLLDGCRPKELQEAMDAPVVARRDGATGQPAGR